MKATIAVTTCMVVIVVVFIISGRLVPMIASRLSGPEVVAAVLTAAALPALVGRLLFRSHIAMSVVIGGIGAVCASAFGLVLVLEWWGGRSSGFAARFPGAVLALCAMAAPFMAVSLVAVSSVPHRDRNGLLSQAARGAVRMLETASRLLLCVVLLFALRHAIAPLNDAVRAIAVVSVAVVAYMATSTLSWIVLRLATCPVPPRLGLASASVEQLIGAKLRPLCLGGLFHKSRSCAVEMLPWGGSRLVISPDVLDALDDEELLAVLVHEGAHVKNWHIIIRFSVSILIAVVVVLVILVGSRLSGGFGLETVIALSAVITAIKLAVDTGLSRRQECEADLIAVKAVGPDAMLRALEKLTPAVMIQRDGIDWSPVSSHDRWQRRRDQIMAMTDSQ